MYSFKTDAITVKIDLEPGVYMTYGDSGEGKSYLAEILRELAKIGEPVNSYTYGEDKIGISLESMLKSEDIMVIMIDRFDMFINSENINAIESTSNKVIIVDLKGSDYDLDITDYCQLYLNGNNIEVGL